MNDDSPDIELSIDELVLHGVPASGNGQFEQAFRRELRRLLAAEPRGRFTGGRIDVRRPIDLRVGHGDSAATLGHQVARAVHGTLRRS